VLQAQPDNEQAFQRPAIAQEQLGDLDVAAATLELARQRVPAKDCAWTTNLAVVHYRHGRVAEALGGLERALAMGRDIVDSGCRAATFYLGQLYAEQSRVPEARAALAAYLDAAAGFQDAMSKALQSEARAT
jgi:tetratricopeptide (TPR) repeat protein